MESPYTYSETINLLQKFHVGGTPIRIERKIAKQLLMENRNVRKDGRVYYLGLRDIGLGICEVWTLDLSISKETKMFPKEK